MNYTLFKATAKANWVILLMITLVILMYVSISITMFDPDNIEKMNAMLDMVPEGMLKAMGFENLGTDLTEYLSNYLYGFIFIMFPMIYCIIVSNKLIAKHVDSGSMAYLLTTPNSRVKIAVTQA
ncbi:MAG: ABC transporter permease subunit, partial [Clostridia bacterium]|nr:ABC transporter permease subunit [Clostridia bacterium]